MAVRFPAEVGLNAIVTVQLAPAASVAPQVFAVTANIAAFGPLTLTDVIVNAALPAFASVNVCAALVDPVLTLPKLAVAGVSAAAATPLTCPVSPTICVEGFALSVTFSPAL